MALWVCAECTTKYAVGLTHCPRCRHNEFYEDGETMPKITRHEGPTIAVEEVPVESAEPIETDEPVEPNGGAETDSSDDAADSNDRDTGASGVDTTTTTPTPSISEDSPQVVANPVRRGRR